MKKPVEKRPPSGIIDYLALALATWGVGYLPIAPGTFGSMVGVLIYLGVALGETSGGITLLKSGVRLEQVAAFTWAANGILLTILSLIGVWAAGRSIPLLGSEDPSQAVVDEVMGQLVTFLFIPFGLSWPFLLAGFLLFRLFDIWKPYPVRTLEALPGGLGVCADDIIAGVYAGICLAIGYAVYLSV